MHVAFAEMKFVLTLTVVFSVCVCARQYNTYPAEVSVVTEFVPRVISKTCLLIPDHGPCRANLKMYFYDPAEKKCKKFTWGGCMGNGNRFDTKKQCLNSCLSQPNPKAKPPRYCSLNFDYGYCFGAAKRYYYDKLWRVCKESVYSGCGGNKNNFYSFDQCQEICIFGHPPLTTKMVTIKTEAPVTNLPKG